MYSGDQVEEQEMGLARDVWGDKGNVYNMLVGKPSRKKHTESVRHKWESLQLMWFVNKHDGRA
jgi:hypothetical protein